jgi:hypothetical protein
MSGPESDNPYAAPQTSGTSPQPVRMGTPPPYTGAANLAIWLFLLPVSLGMVVAAVLAFIQ